MKNLAPAAWIAIVVTLATVLSCGAMIYIAQDHQWSPLETTGAVETQP